GCATKALWNADLDNSNLPAQKVNLRLYAANSDADVLVVYDEYSERHDTTRTRAYLLNQSESRIEQKRAPVFVKTNSFAELKAVPIFISTNAGSIGSSAPVYAVFSTNTQSFMISRAGQVAGPYELPVYDDGRGRAERIALTPIMATADLTIVGGVIGGYILTSMCQAGDSFAFPR
ncbi:MAG TPA: hypothetical protein VGN61_06520, partial [Verrucomicrobiae bacterium]